MCIKNKSFTLIEILVAIGIFFIVIAAPTGFFIASLKGQQRALTSQKLLDQTSYTLEYISRALRMAKKDINGTCISAKLNYKKYEETDSRILEGITYWGPGIKFLNYDGACQEFFLDTIDSQLKESKNEGAPNPLTSADLYVESFKIGPPESWDQNDYDQPRITLFLKIKGKGPRPESQPELKIQTTISQRNLDVVY